MVLRFIKDLEDANTKLTIGETEDDYTIEDLDSSIGTFKIKSGNSLIRLKPFKLYDLSSPFAFYIGKYK